MKKQYVIGSLSQYKTIESVANALRQTKPTCPTDQTEVRYIKPEPNKSFEQCVQTCFDNIEWADIIHIIRKPDGTIGQGVTYEAEYARRLRKPIEYHETRKEQHHV